MSTPDCQFTGEDLKAYVDGELKAARRFVVRRHVASCAACRERMEEMEKIAQTLQASDRIAAPLSPLLRSRLLTSAPAGGSPRPLPLWRRQPLYVLGGGGAAVAASALVFSLLYHAGADGDFAGARPHVMSNLSQVGMGQMQYSQDYDESLPAMKASQSAPSRVQLADDHVVRGRAADGAGAAAEPVVTSPQLPTDKAAFAGQSAAAPAPESSLDMRQVHREASLGVEVTALESASDKVEEMVKADGGYVASDNLSTDGSGVKSAELSVRVPEKDFDTMMASFAKLGSVVAKNVTSEDITDKVSDSTSAEQVLVDNLTTLEQQLHNQSMSERRTGQKEAELRQVQIQLAQTRARLGLLRKMAALATIEISLSEKRERPAAAPTSSFWNGMHETNRAAMLAFQSAIRVPLVLAIWVIAFSPIWAPLLLLYRYAERRSLAALAAGPTPGNAGREIDA